MYISGVNTINNTQVMNPTTLTPKELRKFADAGCGLTIEVMTAICEAKDWPHILDIKRTPLGDLRVRFSYKPGHNAKRWVQMCGFVPVDRAADDKLIKHVCYWDGTYNVYTDRAQKLRVEFHEHVRRMRKACLALSRKGGATATYPCVDRGEHVYA